jgi:hypothetical protein
VTVRKAARPLSSFAHDRPALIKLGHTEEGVPAVSVDLQEYFSGNPAYTDPTLLRRMGAEAFQAATYLERKAKK